MNHFQVLGLQKGASDTEIKNAFYDLSKKYHPDLVGNSPQAAQKFFEVKEAYELLKDEQKRSQYTDQLNSGNADSAEDSFVDSADLPTQAWRSSTLYSKPNVRMSQSYRQGTFFDPTKEMERQQLDVHKVRWMGAVLALAILTNLLYIWYISPQRSWNQRKDEHRRIGSEGRRSE